MLSTIALFLMNCRICRWIALGVLGAGLVLLGLRYVMSVGESKERARQQLASMQARITNLKEKRHAEEDAGRRSPAERAERVRRYSRPD